MIKEKREVSFQDFLDHPVWHVDYEKIIYKPLLSLDTPIGSINELLFRAEFVSPQGFEFDGHITSTGDVSISVYHDGRWYIANKDWKPISLAMFDTLASECNHPDVHSGKDLFPLRFQTTINEEPYIDRSGVFDFDPD